MAVLSPMAPTALQRSNADGAAARNRRALGPLVGLAALGLAGGLALGGCQDASQMFGGLWETSDPIVSTLYAGKVSLAIGHFGREMTGVAHFLDNDGIEVETCPCAYLAQEELDLTARTFVVVSQRCQNTRWIWRLGLDTRGDVDVLAGTVEEQGASDALPVRFELVDRFVSDQEKECAE